MQAKILIVDDDLDILHALKNRLQWLGHEVVTATNGAMAIEEITQGLPDLLLLDLEMPKLSGLDVLKRLADQNISLNGPAHENAPGKRPPRPGIIVMTAFGTVSRAVEAMRYGAMDFLTKPFEVDHLTVIIEKALTSLALSRRVECLASEVDERYETIIGSSDKMLAMLDTVRQAAHSAVTVLLLGETGTGKEVIARAIHRWSPRVSKPFMVVNCAALPENLLENELFGHEKGAYTGAMRRDIGKIEAADGGTVFLDEIGDMPLELQTRFLRVLQEQEFQRVGGHQTVRVDVRFIAATNKDLRSAVHKATFREDLYYRLNVLGINLPPLRERREDIPELVKHFFGENAKTPSKRRLRLDEKAMVALSQYHWPGNVRELENVLARAMVLCDKDVIEVEHLGLSITSRHHSEIDELDMSSLSYHEAMEKCSSKIILGALNRASWNQTKAAEALGLQRTYLTKLLRRRGITGRPPEDT